MNKNVKDILALGFIALIIFLLPSVLDNYFIEKKTDTFFQRVDEDFDHCVKNANEDARNIDWCKKIKRSSELAFNSAKRVSDTDTSVSITQAFVFVLASIILTLKRKIQNLENK